MNSAQVVAIVLYVVLMLILCIVWYTFIHRPERKGKRHESTREVADWGETVFGEDHAMR